MTVTLTSTTRIVEVNGVKCRVWEGMTASGVKCAAMIPRISVHKDEDCSQFEAELQEHQPPSARTVDSFPLRMIL